MSAPAPPETTAASFQPEVDRVLHAAVHPLPREGGHQMRGVARQQHAPLAPSCRRRARGRRRLRALDFDLRKIHEWREQRLKRFVAQQSFRRLARQLHELPAHAGAHRRQLNGRPARIAEESDLIDAMIFDSRVDDEPALDIGRPDEARADRFASRAGSAVAGDDELRAQASFRRRASRSSSRRRARPGRSTSLHGRTARARSEAL